jgi:nucleoid-associated protein YgaU
MPGTPLAFSSTSATSTGGTSAARLEHAKFEVRNPPRAGTTTPGGVRDSIAFQFNPKQLQITKTAKWKRAAQRNQGSSAAPEFTGSDPVKLTLEMFLDATDKMDNAVVTTVEKLFALVVPTSESLSAQKPCPPVVIFRWGGLTGFAAFVTQVQVTYSLFTPGGTPVRATAQVQIEELTPKFPGQNPTSGSDRARTTHRLIDGDTLPELAYREYGDPGRWRDIAAVNGIDDPARLRPGTTLLLPSFEDMAPGGRG